MSDIVRIYVAGGSIPNLIVADPLRRAGRGSRIAVTDDRNRILNAGVSRFPLVLMGSEDKSAVSQYIPEGDYATELVHSGFVYAARVVSSINHDYCDLSSLPVELIGVSEMTRGDYEREHAVAKTLAGRFQADWQALLSEEKAAIAAINEDTAAKIQKLGNCPTLEDRLIERVLKDLK